MMRRVVAVVFVLLGSGWASPAAADVVVWDGRTFETVNVKAAIVTLRGEQVLKVERDLTSLPFDPARLEATVDDRHYLKLPCRSYHAARIISLALTWCPTWRRGVR